MLKAISTSAWFHKIDEAYSYVAKVAVAGYLVGMLFNYYQDAIKEYLYYEQAKEILQMLHKQKVHKVDGGLYYNTLREGGDIG